MGRMLLGLVLVMACHSDMALARNKTPSDGETKDFPQVEVEAKVVPMERPEVEVAKNEEPKEPPEVEVPKNGEPKEVLKDEKQLNGKGTPTLDLNKEQKAVVVLSRKDNKLQNHLEIVNAKLTSLNSKEVRFAFIDGFNGGPMTFKVAEHKFLRENFRPPTFQGNPIYPPGSPALRTEWSGYTCKMLFVEGDTYFYDAAERDVFLLKTDGELTRNDPQDSVRNFTKTHEVALKAGQSYRIDLNTNGFDAYLQVVDSKGKPTKKSESGPKTGMIYRPSGDGMYRITVAGALRKVGQYSLKVRTEQATGGQKGFFSVNTLTGDKDDVRFTGSEGPQRATLILGEGFEPKGPRPPARKVNGDIISVDSKKVAFVPTGNIFWKGIDGKPINVPKDVITWDAAGIRAIIMSGDTFVSNSQRNVFVSLKSLRLRLGK
jgi:hypothetical protein